MTDYFGNFDPTDDSQRLRNIRVIGPYWSAWMTTTIGGNPRQSSAISQGSVGDQPSLIEASVYALRHNSTANATAHNWRSSLFVHGLQPAWLSHDDHGGGSTWQHFEDKDGQRTSRGILGRVVGPWRDNSSGVQGLPVLQLTLGNIPVKVPAPTLKRLQSLLGGSAAEAQPDGGMIWLTPDGVAFWAAVRLPGISPVDLNLWLVLTHGAEGPVLVPWDGAPGDVWSTKARKSAQDNFAAALSPLLRAGRDAATLFDMRPRRPLVLTDYYWPLALQGTGARALVIPAPGNNPQVATRGEALSLRLSERDVNGTEPPNSNLLLLPDDVTLEQATPFEGAPRVKLRASDGEKGAETGALSYNFAAGQERLSLTDLQLQVPLRDMAERFYGADPETKNTHRRLFVPLAEGWLDCGFPTPDVDALADQAGEDLAPPASARSVGAMGIGNADGDRAAYEYPWNITVEGARHFALDCLFGPGAEGPEAQEITLHMTAPIVSSSGLLRGVAHEGNPSRLLPDHAERALAARPLAARDASLLSELERRALNHHHMTLSDVALALEVRPTGVTLTQATCGVQAATRQRAKNGDSFEDIDLSAAVLWRRHAHLPSIQNQNLTHAGEARHAPSGTRELAPFAVLPGWGLIGQPTGLMQLTANGLTSALDAPIGEGEELTWNEQLGMALTTLPSVTLMPQPTRAAASARRGSDAWVPVADGWADDINAAVRLRYDVALRDGKRASTDVPKPRKPDDENAPNAPGALATDAFPEVAFDTTPGVDSITRATAVWGEAFRADVLSAVAMRDMLAKGPRGTTRLTNLGRGSFDLTDQVTADFTLKPAANSLGQYSLTGLTPTPLDLRGLPWSALDPESDTQASSDVEGLTFDKGTVQIIGGAAALSRTAGGSALEDQFGVTLQDAVAEGDFVLRAISGLAGPQTLISCRQPISIGPVLVWFSDLATDASGFWQRPDEGAKFPNAHHPELNPQLSHRWWIGAQGEEGDETKDDLLTLFGVHFRPTGLRTAEVKPADKVLTLEISGQILMKAIAGEGRAQSRDVGGATLSLSRTADGRETVKLTSECLSIPLRDPDGTVAPVGRVVLKSADFQQEQLTVTGAHLDLPLLGRHWQVALDASSDAPGQLSLVKKGLTQGTGAKGGTLRMTEAVVDIGGAGYGVTRATGTCHFSVGTYAPLQVSGLTYDLTAPDPFDVERTAALHAPGLDEGDSLAATFTLTTAGAALVWEADGLARSFLPGIDITASRGWALAAFATSAPGTTEPFVTLEDWQVSLHHRGAPLIQARYDAQSGGKDGPWKVTADLNVENAIHFPLPLAEPVPDLPTLGTQPKMLHTTIPAAAFNAPLRHAAQIELSGHPLAEEVRQALTRADGVAKARLSVKVTHNLSHDGETTSWVQYQQVRIWSMTALRRHLKLGGAGWSGWKANAPSGLFSRDHAADFAAALPQGAGVLGMEFGAGACLEKPSGGFVLAALPAFGMIGGALGSTLDRLLNRAGGALTQITLPQIEAALEAAGPGQQLRRRRAADLAGRADNAPEGDFIAQNLTLPLMSDWRTRAQTNGRDYLTASLGLRQLLWKAGTGTRPALSLLPHDNEADPFSRITGVEPFFEKLTAARSNSFIEARPEGMRVVADEGPQIMAVSGATGLLIAPRAYVASTQDNADHKVYLLGKADRTASIGVLTGSGVAHRLVRNADVPSAQHLVALAPIETEATNLRDTQFVRVSAARAAQDQPYLKALQAGPTYQSATPEIVSASDPKAGNDPLARATRRALSASLATSGQALEDAGARVWLSEASRPLLRPATTAGPENPASIAFDPGEDEALPLAYDPGGGALPEEAGAPGKSYFPAGVTVSRLSQTSGVFHADQIRAVVAATDGLVARSSTAALFQRSPRPGQLGRNARLRPSQFETGHVVLSRQPVSTLYGTPLPRGEAGSRAADARSAYRVRMTIPKDGVIDPRWTGDIELTLTALPGSDRSDVLGEFEAWVVLQDVPHALTVTANSGGTLRFRPSAPEEMTLALAQLDGIETAQFVMMVTIKPAQATPFKRRISLNLWARDNGGEPLIERPGYILFEDPALDDLTRGASHMTARSLTRRISGEQVFWSFRIASESDEIAPQQTFTLVLGALNPQSGLFGTGAVEPGPSRLRLVRLRPSEDPDAPPTERNIWPRPDPNADPEQPQWEPVGALFDRVFDPVLDFQNDDAIAAGDTLLAEWNIGDTALRLFIRVQQNPRPSDNPATYAVLGATMSDTKEALTCQNLIYDESGDPSDRELIDPSDLLTGIANFRNRFRYRIFLAPGQGVSLLAVQKIDGVGGSWLPGPISTGWLGFEE